MIPNTLCVNGGGLLRTAGGLRFINPPVRGAKYCNAQIDDYQGLPRRHFPNRPPLQLTLRARFSHPAGMLSGTAGFGFWNDPFLMTDLTTPMLPRALWFFYAAPPSNAIGGEYARVRLESRQHWIRTAAGRPGGAAVGGVGSALDALEWAVSSPMAVLSAAVSHCRATARRRCGGRRYGRMARVYPGVGAPDSHIPGRRAPSAGCARRQAGRSAW